MKNLHSLFAILCIQISFAQDIVKIRGVIYQDQKLVSNVTIYNSSHQQMAISDWMGNFQFDTLDNQVARYYFYQNDKLLTTQMIEANLYKSAIWKVEIETSSEELEEVVISGTMRAVSKIESPVPVEIIRAAHFKKNPTSNIFEALQTVNGVRPQINCNVCNTGDIHINGLEGPYTMVLIDGMPIVSGLSTVYGLSGIPISLIDRVEIVKGPASSLYGSEAVGGLINIITKNPFKTPRFSVDFTANSWAENNLDLGCKANVSPKTSVLLGINYFNYSNPIDNNGDNFTDLTLQDRISIFQKWQFDRSENRLFSVAARYFYEDRWGGEMQWNKSFRGTDEVYGESIYTKRLEVLGTYQLPFKEKIFLNISFTNHDQNSVYGDVFFLAKQKIGFLQTTWDQSWKSHSFLFGTSIRYDNYNDNTPATLTTDEKVIPSIFVQDEIKINPKNALLLGIRWDHHKNHGSIFTPRLAYRFKFSDTDILRLNAGTGFRAVNLFTEEHAALTGSRDVIILDNLKPEKSININLNYLKKISFGESNFGTVETTAWHTRFSNSILPDYDSNPNQIIYKNLNGYAVTQGLSANIDFSIQNKLHVNFGATWMDVYKRENGIKTIPILTEKFMATWSVSYLIKKWHTAIDYTGNLVGPMRLPLLGELDPRRHYSPTWSVQNIQLTFKKWEGIEIYAGVKNLINWTPNKGNPFLIARAHDPFDKNVEFDIDGNPMSTIENPFALTFDPSYVFAPNQGIRLFAGVRYFLF